MALYELSQDSIAALTRRDFVSEGILERADLQRLLRDHIDVIAPDTLIISEEFSSWDTSDRRIDLLAVDSQARLVVIELKRTTDDSLADLQALRYAAMVSQMTFDEAVDTYGSYLEKRGLTDDAQKSLLDFFHWPEAGAGRFGEDVRIVLAAADFSPEVTTTVLWLNERDMDIRCVRMQPYRLGSSLILDVQQIIPLPEVAAFQVQIRQKQREVRAAVEQSSSDWTRYDVTTEEGIHQALYKREVVLEAIRQLVKRCNMPAQIEEAAGRHLFEVAEGTIDEEACRAELAKRRPNDPNVAKRFFVRNDQLFHADGKTYTLTNQWSKSSMEALLAALAARFGDYGFSIRPTD
jgi:hypothetical protein